MTNETRCERVVVPPASADYAGLPVSLMQFRGEPFFPIGVYSMPADINPATGLAAYARAGFNFILLPPSTEPEVFKKAGELGVKVMVPVGELLCFDKHPDPESARVNTLKLLGPGSAIYESTAVVALEFPDEPLWNEKNRVNYARHESYTWVLAATEQAQIHALIRSLKNGYEWLNKAIPGRYAVWLNFAPRSHEEELRWFSELEPSGGYPPDARTAADAFGTDVYPVPDGGGNNGWVNGGIALSPAAAGVFADRLRRAFYPHPFYMVLQGCGILEWDPAAKGKKSLRRPTLEETRFMAFQSIVHGARGLLYWGSAYIESDSQIWRDIQTVAGEVSAYSPVLLEGKPWTGARIGGSRQESLAHTYQGDHVILVVNTCDITDECALHVPGWRGKSAKCLLDDRVVPVRDSILMDDIPPYGVRIYTDGENLTF